MIARKAADHIRRFSAEGRPFFLYIAPFSPHSPYNPAVRHVGLFEDVRLPRPPSFDEADVSDKPGFLQELPRLREDQIDEIEAHHRRRLQCLQSVDDLVETVVQALEATGQLDNTYIVYTSDNGFHLGLHRMVEGKDTAYEEDIRVPFAVRGPGIPRGQQIGALALTIDLAPTFAAWAGAAAPDFVDGRSLIPLLARSRDALAPQLHRAAARPGERRAAQPANALAIRTGRHTFVAYNDGEHELYDLAKDPFQLENIEPAADPVLTDALATRLTELSACSGQECRDLEELPLE